MREIELPNGKTAQIGDENDLTIQEQWDIEHAGMESESVGAQMTLLQLEELARLRAAIPEDAIRHEMHLREIINGETGRAAERKEAQEELNTILNARKTVALSLATRRMGPKDYAPVDHFQVVKVLCFLRQWDVTDREGNLIAIPDERTYETVQEFARISPNSVLKLLYDETLRANLDDTNFNKNGGAIKNPKAPTADSGGSDSPVVPSPATRSTRKAGRSSTRTKS
jgi:hypothetical protein